MNDSSSSSTPELSPPRRPSALPDRAGSDESSVLVSSGIHRGRFPVGGMTVRAARRVLGPMINIDPSAVAVINGQIVDEDTVLERQPRDAELREAEFAQGLVPLRCSSAPGQLDVGAVTRRAPHQRRDAGKAEGTVP